MGWASRDTIRQLHVTRKHGGCRIVMASSSLLTDSFIQILQKRIVFTKEKKNWKPYVKDEKKSGFRNYLVIMTKDLVIRDNWKGAIYYCVQ